MFAEEQILDFLNGKVREIVRAKQRKKTPELNPIYEKSVKMAREISVHSEYDADPSILLKSRAPNETPASYDYRLSIWEPVTFPYWNRALNEFSKFWNDQNFRIHWREEEHEEYFAQNYPDYGSFLAFFRDVAVSKKISDPNAVITILPKSIPFVENEHGEVIVDESEKIDFVAKIYPAKKVIDFQEGHFALVKTNFTSTVTVGNTKVQEGLVFEFYDDVNIWRLVQKGKKDDWKFEPMLLYAHGLGKLPAKKLKGLPIQIKDATLYMSYFYPAVPNLNVAASTHSTLDMTIYSQAFPQRWEYVDECDNTGCVAGMIFEGDEQVNCPKCKGSGKSSIKNGPVEVYQVKTPNRNDDSAKDISTPPFGYVAPNTDVMEFSYKKIMNDIIQAFSFINIDVSGEVARGDETATGKLIDREGLMTFLTKVSNEVFDLFEWSINTIGELRFVRDWERPIVKRPTSFAIRTDFDLTQEIAQAKANHIPDIAIREMLAEFLRIRFGKTEENDTILAIIFGADRLISATPLEIVQGIASGTIKKWEAILHSSAITFIDEAIREDENYLEKDLSEQIEVLRGKAKDKQEEISPTIDPDTFGISGADGIETPINVEAEAKAKLKGTVGGVQGIIQINQAVAQGQMTEESAELLLQEIYGFDEATAKRLIDKTGVAVPPTPTPNIEEIL